METRERMEQLISILKEAAYAYYQKDEEIMSNFEYDALYDELVKLEEETGMILSGSPTQSVGYEAVSSLPKVRHAQPMKSLDKTKDIEALAAFAGNRRSILSWKLDGLTIVLTYDRGELTQAATRGNGEIGEIVTNNARFFGGVPRKIPYLGHLVVRGEALISYEDFRKINEKLAPEEQYKNPRNLCSGSVRQLNSKVAAERNVQVVSYTLVESEKDEADFNDSKEEQMKWLSSLGFTIVEYKIVDENNMAQAEKEFSDAIPAMAFPVDGLVVTLDSIEESRNAGFTAKFPRDSMAFKWQDETAETTLREIEWSPSRTGLINPVAIFDPVELEGTTVRRASIHNVSVMQGLKLGIGDRIRVYKANMIIPQISENLTGSGTLEPPCVCPRCQGKTMVSENDGVKILLCTNPACPAKSIKALSLFVSRQAMNIEGLSESTLEKIIDLGILETFADLYRLKDHKEELLTMEGFGKRACEKLLNAIEVTREPELFRVIAGIGIPGIGTATARVLSRSCGEDMDVLMKMTREELSAIDGIGDIMADDIRSFLENEENQKMIGELLSFVHPQKKTEEEGEEAISKVNGLIFVVTGSLEHFKSRDELKDLLLSKGAKVASAVSKNTNFLINNDALSTSSKNKKAKELGVEIITEEELMERFLS